MKTRAALSHSRKLPEARLRPRVSLKTFLICCLILFTAVNSSLALNVDRLITQFGVTTWTGSDNLPSLSINAVLQTHDGYLWLATDGGLVRFDGKRFDTFSTSNSKLAGNGVSALWQDRNNVLWIGFSNGSLCTLRSAENFTCLGSEAGLPLSRIQAITGDDEGAVWIATAGQGVARLREGKLTMLTVADGLPSKGVTSLLLTRDGSLWISTYDAGVAIYKEGSIRVIAKPVIPSNLVWKMQQDQTGAIWLATFDGLCKLSSSADKHPLVFRTASGLPGNHVTGVYVDHAGTVWATVNDGGLSRLRNGKVSTLTTRDGLADMSVLALAEDTEGDLWLGTKSGLNRLRDQPFTIMGEREGLPGDAVRVVFEDRKADLWAGTYTKGLVRLTSSGHFTKPQHVPIGTCSPLAAYEDERADLWLGCAGGIIIRRRSQITIGEYHLGESSRFVEVNALAESPDHRLFAATFGAGLAEFRNGVWIPKAIRPAAANISALLGNSKGLWVATIDSGIFRINPDGSVFNYVSEPAVRTPLTLNQDSDGSIWVTTEHGLAHIDGDKFQQLQLSGLPLADDALYNVLDDGIGSYWISSSRGIYRMPRSSLQALAQERKPAEPPVLFSSMDGVIAVNYVGFAQPTALRAHNGQLWFTTTKGLLSVDPRTIASDQNEPAVYIQAILADDERIRGSPQIPPDKHRLEIQYAAISLKMPEKVRFRYRLVGHDADWIEAGSRRSAFYTDLGPGEYRFRVMAANRAGHWSEHGAEVVFRKFPRYYQTLWFRLACIAAALLTALTAYKRHVKRMRREISLVQAAIAREQQKAAREKVEELSAANDVLQKAAAKMTQVVAPEGLPGVFLREAMDLTGASAGTVFRRVGATELVLVSLVQDGQETPAHVLEQLPCAIEKRLSSREDANGYFARLMKGAAANWLVSNPNGNCPPATLEYHRLHGHLAVWDFPFSLDDRVEGVISLAFRSLDPPSDLVTQTITALNNQLAIALKLTQLNEEAKRIAVALEREQTLTEERTRVAREIHDTLAQSFTGILMQLQAAAEYSSVNPQIASACITRAESMARDGLLQARSSVMSLYPKEQQLDLVDRIRAVVERALTDTGTKYQFEVIGDVQPLDAIVAANTLRICQEALNNAQRYAGASSIVLTLRFSSEEFSMTIQDDGAGFDIDSAEALGFGLNGMRARASRIGAKLLINSGPGSGTTILLRVPLPVSEAQPFES